MVGALGSLVEMSPHLLGNPLQEQAVVSGDRYQLSDVMELDAVVDPRQIL